MPKDILKEAMSAYVDRLSPEAVEHLREGHGIDFLHGTPTDILAGMRKDMNAPACQPPFESLDLKLTLRVTPELAALDQSAEPSLAPIFSELADTLATHRVSQSDQLLTLFSRFSEVIKACADEVGPLPGCPYEEELHGEEAKQANRDFLAKLAKGISDELITSLRQRPRHD